MDVLQLLMVLIYSEYFSTLIVLFSKPNFWDPHKRWVNDFSNYVIIWKAGVALKLLFAPSIILSLISIVVFALRPGFGGMTSCYTIQAVWIYHFTLSCMIQFKRSTTHEAFLLIVVYRYITFLNAAIWTKAQLFYCSTWRFFFSHHHSFVCKAPAYPSFLTCPFHVMFRCFYIWIFGPVLCRPPILEVKKYNVFLQHYRGWKMC